MSAENDRDFPDLSELEPAWEQIRLADSEVTEGTHYSIANTRILLTHLKAEITEDLLRVAHRARRYGHMLMDEDFLTQQGRAFALFVETRGSAEKRNANETDAKNTLASEYPLAARRLAAMAPELCVENVYPQPIIVTAAAAITMLQLHELRKKQSQEDLTSMLGSLFATVMKEGAATDLGNVDIAAVAAEEAERHKADLRSPADTSFLETSDWSVLKDIDTAPKEAPAYEYGSRETLEFIGEAERAIANANMTLLDARPHITDNIIRGLGQAAEGNLSRVCYQAYRLACFLRDKIAYDSRKAVEDFHASNPIPNHFEYDRDARAIVNNDPLLSRKLDICLRLLETYRPNEDELAESVACIFLVRIAEQEAHAAEQARNKFFEDQLRDSDAAAIERETLESWLGDNEDTSSDISDEK